MVVSEPTTGVLGESTGASTESATGATLVHFKQEPPRHRDLPAEAVERARARIDEIGSAWTPSVEIDVEEMLRGA
jgi:hypothetical protein